MNKQLIDIARDHGIEQTQQGNGEWLGRCPRRYKHPHGDVHPACDINTDKNSWFCRTCNVGGGPVQYEQELEASGHLPTASRGVERNEVTPEMRATAAALHNLGQMGLLPGSVGAGWLEARGIDLHTAEMCGIGVAEMAPGNLYGIAAGRYITFTFADENGPVCVKFRDVADKHNQRIVPAGAPQILFLGMVRGAGT